ncbi:MAG TPA: class I SAM-dependent methyltransferase [Burkholderiales bacterium]|nr:class I SAM-dependent methyltransferase [Burkholderiales bacterium]
MKSGYSRAAPSPRYRRLIEQYQLMHENGDTRLGIPAALTFAGQSLPRQAGHIKRWIERTGAQSILDYGSGKGEQYSLARLVDPQTQIDHPDIRSYWGVKEIRCFDPAYDPFAELPSGTFDGVICTDVLEHCPEEDIPWILGELFAFAGKFVFANIACFPARKFLPSGGNAHCTVKPQKWWQQQIERAAAAKPALPYEFRLAYRKANEVKEQAIQKGEAE